MRNTRATISIASLIASGMLGVDAMVYSGEVLPDRVEQIAGEQVAIKQIGNVVEADAPWKDQPGIKVKYDLGETTVAERMADRRKNEIIYERVDFGDGGFKIDVLLNEKPDTNVFCYAIEGAENYDFFYQPPLTPEEIAEGASRPPEIEGSYAVYHKTLKNHRVGAENYATGKVMHIPRPQVWELGNEANKVWADLSYDDGQLCVTAPQDFIDNADYTNGVRIDPTFGYTALGASAATISDADDAQRYTYGYIGENGIVTSFSYGAIQFDGTDTNTTAFVVALYASSTSALISPQSDVGAVGGNAVAQFFTVNVTGELHVTPTDYKIVAFSDDNDGDAANTIRSMYDSGDAYFVGTSITTGLSYPTWADPHGTLIGTAARYYSIYATYTAIPQNVLNINNGTIRLNNGTLDL